MIATGNHEYFRFPAGHTTLVRGRLAFRLFSATPVERTHASTSSDPASPGHLLLKEKAWGAALSVSFAACFLREGEP